MFAVISGRTTALIITFVLTAVICGIAMAEEIDITGEVNDNYQIVSENGIIYEIADTDVGNEMLEQMVGRKVRVNGILHADGGATTIEVLEYEDASE